MLKAEQKEALKQRVRDALGPAPLRNEPIEKAHKAVLAEMEAGDYRKAKKLAGELLRVAYEQTLLDESLNDAYVRIVNEVPPPLLALF